MDVRSFDSAQDRIRTFGYARDRCLLCLLSCITTGILDLTVKDDMLVPNALEFKCHSSDIVAWNFSESGRGVRD